MQRDVCIIPTINEKPMAGRHRVLAIFFACATLAGASIGLAQEAQKTQGAAVSQEAGCPSPTGPPVQIASVDTHLELRLADGRKLRLRGIEPPRGTPGNPGLAEAARLFLADRVEGMKLSADIAVGAPDRWGRQLAILASDRAVSTSAELIAAGWARFEPGDAQPGCETTLLRLESNARDARQGLWADPAYAVLAANDHASFAGRGGQIVLMEGTIVSTGQWRSLTFLNLGRDRRADPAIVLSRRLAAALEKTGQPIASLKGARIRVRGLLQTRNSPRIEIYSTQALERLAPADLEPNQPKKSSQN